MKLTTDIIPKSPTFIGYKKDLDLEAICVFVALGFFLDRDTYYKDLKVLKPARHYKINQTTQQIISESPYFKWHHTPKERSLAKVVFEFGELFESIIKEQTEGKNVILPLSGGLDSRTQAVALNQMGIPTKAYGYAFEGGHDETWYGKQISKLSGFSFKSLEVPNGYLWKDIERLGDINGCYSEFTHPRQMAFIDTYSDMGNIFSLGHWGDVLFDDMNVSESLSTEEQVEIILKKIIKKKGLELAKALWKYWDLPGEFSHYLKVRIQNLLKDINIVNSANAQIRAFKSLYWAPRWTSVNLSVFKSVRPISMPYYDNRMCEFICSVPERYLAGRQIQIAYIKERSPEMAALRWEAQRPFNLYNYRYNKFPYNLPYRITNKLYRAIQTKPYVQRNWELQFLGSQNDTSLKAWLFENPYFNEMVPKVISEQFYKSFKQGDSIQYAHAISMLLTLSVFSKSHIS